MEGCRCEVSGRHARTRQGGVDHELRCLHRAGAGHRRSRAHQRDELDPQRSTPVQARIDRRGNRSGRPQGRSERGEDLARHETDRAGSVGRAAAQVPRRDADLRQGAQPHELRRVRRDRAGDRWPDPHLGHVVDEARPASLGSGEEGRHRRRHHLSTSIPTTSASASDSSRPRRIRGSGSARRTRSAPSCEARSCGSWRRASSSTSATTSKGLSR